MNDWLKNGWLRPHSPSAGEVEELLAVVERDLHDCRARGLSDDWQFNIAYNAMLQLARIALHGSGYEVPKGDSHHFRAIDSLTITVGIPAAEVDQLQVFRKKRSAGVYETAGMITPGDAAGMVKVATDLRQRVIDWLAREHPQLLGDQQ